jgi:lipoic acid synthetase
MIKSENIDIKAKPGWLKIRLPKGENYLKIKDIVAKNQLHTICSSGKCPNIAECWGSGTATFLILGNICTRSCMFCAVETGRPKPVDPYEPENVARSVKLMNLKHCVITSVDRDDLEDGGSEIWEETIRKVKEKNPDTTVEVLIPDFRGNKNDIRKIIGACPDVISHNLETVERLTPVVRSIANYRRSLDVLRIISGSGLVCKSGIMAGLGETAGEVLQTMDDLLDAGCRVMTIGQYLQPSKENMEVVEYISPETFEKYRTAGIQKGFRVVESGPLVRSSYHAERHVL